MHVRISGRHVAVTDAMRQHARDRVQRLERYSHHIMHVGVTLSIEADRHTAEIVASVRKKGELVAKAESHDMYQSVDQAADKMEKRLHKLEGRAKGRRGASRLKQILEEAGTAETEESVEADEL